MSETPLAPGSPAPPILPTRHQDNVQASFLLIAALALFTSETLCVRFLNGVSTPTQAVLFRSLAQLVVVGAWMLWRRQMPLLRSPHLKLHLARGIVSIISWYLYYRSFQKLEFSLATLLSFASSLFVVLLASPVLGERVHPVSWVATIAGFGGIALAAGAGGGPVSLEVILGLAGAFFAALLLFLTRKLALVEDTVTIMMFIGLIVTAAAIPVAAYSWQPLTLGEGALISVGSLFGAIGMILLIEAYSRGQASVLAPINYLRLAFAILFAYLFLAEVPSLRMLAGAAIVVVSALAAMHFEHLRKRRPTG